MRLVALHDNWYIVCVGLGEGWCTALSESGIPQRSLCLIMNSKFTKFNPRQIDGMG